MLRNFICIFLALTLAPLVLAKKYENKQYRPKADSLPLVIAILPVPHENDWIKETADKYFEQFYSDTGLVMPKGPSSFRQKIADDSLMASWFTEVARYEYSKEQRKGVPTLYQILDSTQVQKMAEFLGHPDLLLVPTGFWVGSVIGRAAGKMSLRLYDLRTGDLVYEKDQNLNVDLSGEVGTEYIILGLVSFTRDPYHKYVLEPLKGGK